MNSYQAIIFDLGNVIINISFDKMFDYWAEVYGYDVNMIKRRFEFDEMYHQFEKGKIETNVYRKYVVEKLGLHISEVEFDKGWNDIYLDLVPGIGGLLQVLKSRFRLLALTNTNKAHAAKWKNKYAQELANFEKVFCSHEIGARKPERKVYEIVLDYLKLEPNRVLFLDDKLENVKAASRSGMKGILVKSSHQMIGEIVKLGIDIADKK